MAPRDPALINGNLPSLRFEFVDERMKARSCSHCPKKQWPRLFLSALLCPFDMRRLPHGSKKQMYTQSSLNVFYHLGFYIALSGSHSPKLRSGSRGAIAAPAFAVVTLRFSNALLASGGWKLLVSSVSRPWGMEISLIVNDYENRRLNCRFPRSRSL